MYLFSKVPAKPYADVKQFPELAVLKDNWEMIRDEGLKLFDEDYIRAAAKYNDVGFNSFFRTGWKRFYLKWYDDFLPSAITWVYARPIRINVISRWMALPIIGAMSRT